MKNVVVFIPTFGGMLPALKFERSLEVALYRFQAKHSKEYALIKDYCTVGPHLEANRNVCVGRAIEGYDGWHPDITVWLDSDLILPAGILERLICRDDYKVVAGMYYAKRGKYPICFRKGVYDKENDIQLYDSVIDYPDKDFEVDYPGEGCFRIDVSVLKEMKPPYFQWNYRSPLETGQDKIEFLVKYGVRNGAEGAKFFEQVRNLGHKIIVDPKIQCKHIGSTEVSQEDFIKKWR